MAVNIQEIGKLTSGTFLQKPLPDAVIAHLVFDTRKIAFPDSCLFFALRGIRQDGHRFIGQAYDKGVRNFIVSDPSKVPPVPEANVVLVPDVLRALQVIARWHRHQFQIPVIGITGSNGKTIVKEWLFQVLQTTRLVVRSPKSYNSQIGVPVSVWQLESRHEVAIFEAGISTSGEMEHLAPIIDCTYGIFTNIGEAHQEGFSSMEEKVTEKAHLFQNTPNLIYCGDHDLIAHHLQARYPERTHFFWTRKSLPLATLSNIQERRDGLGTHLTGVYKGQKVSVYIPFLDRGSIENALHVWVTALILGVSPEIISERMRLLESVAMRLEMKAGINNCLLIDDAYSSDLTSMNMALDFMKQQSAHQFRTLILSDILQAGISEEDLYRQVASLIVAYQVTRFIGIGDAIRKVGKYLPPGIQTYFFNRQQDFLDQFSPNDFKSETILLKGARKFELERIANLLVRKYHKTVLEINLDAVKHNLNVFSSMLNPGVKMLVMVKASGYGSGSAEVAQLLAFQHVDYLAVAYADEGVELRKAGIRLPILVLNPEEATFDALLKYNLEPELYSLSQLQALQKAFSEIDGPVPIHLKLETGMNRLGFEPAQISELVMSLNEHENLVVRSVFSHLAASEDAAQDAFTHQQARRFEEMYQILTKGLGYKPDRHLLNTSGIQRFPQYQFEMVRLGIGLYGIESSGTGAKALQQVLTLKATISQVKRVNKGDTIGYGRKGKAESEMRIATISIGYADGLLRLAGNGRYSVEVAGKLAPIVGNVCMDMAMIDVTGIPEAVEGSEVIVFGERPKVEELANSLNTIPYEVLTNISERVKRVYYQNG